jgi:hypothetical protein
MPHQETLTRSILASLLAVLLAVSIGCKKAASPPAPEPATSTEGHSPFGIAIVDSHVHIFPTMPALARALEVFDRVGIRQFVAKSGGDWGSPRFTATVAMKRVLGVRFEFFCNIDWDGIDRPDFGTLTAARLEKAAAAGAKGVKIFKALGLSVKTDDGKLVPVDDPKLDPIFDKAADLGLIVAMHTADPVAFFLPPTPDNERYAELSIAKSWSFHGPKFPSHDELLAQRDRRLARHPRTRFLLIHVANYPEDLAYVDRLLSTHANVWIDTAARLPELGRHPAEAARAFFIKHQDRILFGSDFISSSKGMQLGSVWHVPDQKPGIEDALRFYEAHWAYFETHGKQIDHPTPIQGDWKVDAIGLPEAVLRKLYRSNAEELIFEPLRPLAGHVPEGGSLPR